MKMQHVYEAAKIPLATEVIILGKIDNHPTVMVRVEAVGIYIDIAMARWTTWHAFFTPANIWQPHIYLAIIAGMVRC